jgi:hypothetical protein
MVPNIVLNSAVAVSDSIDRVDYAGGNSVDQPAAPTIRKDFPESWIWDTIDGYGTMDNKF